MKNELLDGILIGIGLGIVIMTILFLYTDHKKNMFCPVCGEQYENAEYCIHDGSRLLERKGN